MAKKEKDDRGLSMQDLRGAMAEEHPGRDAGMSVFMAMTSDTIEEQQPEGTYRFALNGVMEDRETAGRLQNEESNEECIDITGDTPAEYDIILEPCCGDAVSLSTESLEEIAQFVSDKIEECGNFIFHGIVVNGYVVTDDAYDVKYIAILIDYLEANGFGTYRITFVGCAEPTYRLIVRDCCNHNIIYEYPEGSIVNTSDITIPQCDDVIVYKYRIDRGLVVEEANIPLMSPREITMDSNVAISYDCIAENEICTYIQGISQTSSLDTSKTTGYIRHNTVGGLDYYTFYRNNGMVLWFEIPYSSRGLVGQVVNMVHVESNLTSEAMDYTIDVQSNDVNADNAVLIDLNGHSYICITLPHLYMWEMWDIIIGNRERYLMNRTCMIEFVIVDSSILVVDGKSLTMDQPIVDVSKTDFGFTTKDGKSAPGIIGNYNGSKLISGFVVKDGFGNKYVSGSDAMEINLFHNDKIELIYG